MHVEDNHNIVELDWLKGVKSLATTWDRGDEDGINGMVGVEYMACKWWTIQFQWIFVPRKKIFSIIKLLH